MLLLFLAVTFLYAMPTLHNHPIAPATSHHMTHNTHTSLEMSELHHHEACLFALWHDLAHSPALAPIYITLFTKTAATLPLQPKENHGFEYPRPLRARAPPLLS